MKNFFRNDLNLKNKWWHRFLKVIFIIFIGLMATLGYNDFHLIGYSKLGSLSEYIQDKPKTVKEIISSTGKNDVVLSSDSEPTNGKDYPWIVPRESICAKNLMSTIKYFESKGYELYTGPVFGRVESDTQKFLKYTENNKINCIIPTFYTDTYGRDVPMIQTYEDDKYNSDNTFLYVPSKLKTIWYFIFGTYFSNSAYVYPGIWSFTLIPALALIFFYYKIVLYVIFGANKSNQ